VPGSPFGTGSTPFSVAIDPSGRFIYVTNAGSKSISVYANRRGDRRARPGRRIAVRDEQHAGRGGDRSRWEICLRNQPWLQLRLRLRDRREQRCSYAARRVAISAGGGPTFIAVARPHV
jgi:hypothetical protein